MVNPIINSDVFPYPKWVPDKNKLSLDVAAMGFPGFTIVGLASKAVEEAREKKREIIYHTGFKEKDAAINALLFAISVFREGRTQRQFQAVSAYRKYRTQKKASRAMGIDQVMRIDTQGAAQLTSAMAARLHFETTPAPRRTVTALP